MIREASELFERMGVAIDPLALVDNLKTSEKQLLEIAKALLHNAKLLILDEPTGVLTPQETTQFFRCSPQSEKRRSLSGKSTGKR